MPVHRWFQESAEELSANAFANLGLSEQAIIQRILRDRLEVIDPDVLELAEDLETDTLAPVGSE